MSRIHSRCMIHLIVNHSRKGLFAIHFCSFELDLDSEMLGFDCWYNFFYDFGGYLFFPFRGPNCMILGGIFFIFWGPDYWHKSFMILGDIFRGFQGLPPSLETALCCLGWVLNIMTLLLGLNIEYYCLGWVLNIMTLLIGLSIEYYDVMGWV